MLRQRRDLRRQVKDLQRPLRQERRRRHDRVAWGRDKQRRAGVPLHAMGLSLNQIEDTFALLLPKGRAPDRSTIGHWVRHAEHQAGRVLPALDAQARPRAATMALDEIFFRRQPCLVGVEPASRALLLCQRTPDRTAATWKQALVPFTGLNYVCADAGSGLQKALAQVDAERRHEDRLPLERGLDHFHTAQEAQHVLGRLWKRVEARWDEAEEADRKVVAADRKGHDGRGPATRARVAWKRVASAMEWYDGRRAAGQRARQALMLLQPNGPLNDRTQAERALAAACVGLPGRPWKKVRAFLTDRRTLTFLDRTQRQVVAAEARPEVRAALRPLLRCPGCGGWSGPRRPAGKAGEPTWRRWWYSAWSAPAGRRTGPSLTAVCGGCWPGRCVPPARWSA